MSDVSRFTWVRQRRRAVRFKPTQIVIVDFQALSIISNSSEQSVARDAKTSVALSSVSSDVYEAKTVHSMGARFHEAIVRMLASVRAVMLMSGFAYLFSSAVKFVTKVTDWLTCCETRSRRIFLPSGVTS